jgi:hypothetical protein
MIDERDETVNPRLELVIVKSETLKEKNDKRIRELEALLPILRLLVKGKKN